MTGLPKPNAVTASALVLGLVLCTPASFAQVIELRPDVPSQYVVVEGDTLWDIAGTFLEEPWMWPEVWQINPQIENPDLIYPGDLIELSFVDGEPVLRLTRGAEVPEGVTTVRLSPQVRRERLLSPIPAISLDQISAYLSANSIVSTLELDNAPYVLAEREGRTLLSIGNEVMARGNWTAGELTYDVVRAGRAFEDPDSGESLGLEAEYIGTATITRGNAAEAFLQVNETVEEIRAGDRLIPRQSTVIDSSYMPAPPPFAVDAAIVSISGGDSIGGTYDTLVLNVGADDGLGVGHILTVREPDAIVEDRIGDVGAWQRFKQALGFDFGHRVAYPGETVGTVLIYRVFADTSMGLVLKSNRALRLNDRAVTPE